MPRCASIPNGRGADAARRFVERSQRIPLRSTRSPSTSGLALVLVASGALGFHLGYTRYPDWQVAVETAQVVAGIVVYPPDNPFYLYHARLWTILHQIGAILLKTGTSEIVLSRVLSGTLGMLSFQALAAVTYGACRNVLVSSGVAVLLFVTASPETGASYPIFMMGVPFTYGIAGLSLVVLTMALIGSGFPRAGGFLLGVSPAVHPSLGAWLWMIVAVAWLADARVRATVRAALPFFLTGCVVTGASLGTHLLMASRVPGLAAEVSRVYFDAFVEHWDGHRQPISLGSEAIWMNLGMLLLTTVWLRVSAARAETSDGFPPAVLLRLFQTGAVVALALVPISWAPHEQVPLSLLILMPGRVLNIATFAFPALVIGAIAMRPTDVRAAALLAAFGAGLLLSDASALWRLAPAAVPAWRPSPHLVTLAAAAGAALLIRSKRPLGTTPLAALLTPVVSIPIVVTAAALAYTTAEDRSQLFADRTNNGFLFAVSRERGVLLGPGEMYLLQLRTRRPVLIDAGALDTLAYTPETGPAMHRILRDVYGVDMLDPPPEVRGLGRLPAELHRHTWEGFAREDWLAIGREYHVTNVLTEGDWVLDLPVVAQSSRYLLYRVADE